MWRPWGAYGVAQRTSDQQSEFGAGAEDGVIAPTSANNAAVAGAWIPALVFGVPGDAVTAIVLGALMVYDIKPGPQIFETSGPLVTQLLWIACITQFLLVPAGLLGLAGFRVILKLPRRHIMGGVVIFSIVGAYAIRNSMFDVYVMIAAGALGWFLESQRAPVAPARPGLDPRAYDRGGVAQRVDRQRWQLLALPHSPDLYRADCRAGPLPRCPGSPSLDETPNPQCHSRIRDAVADAARF